MRLRVQTLAALLAVVAAPLAAQPADAFTVLFGEGDVVAVRSGPGGTIYILGESESNELPTRSGFQPDLAPGDCDGRIGREAPCPDLFVAKLNAGGELAYLTYLGGSGPERAIDLQVDADGAAYVLGHTESEDLPETARVGPPAESYVGSFLAKISPDGGALLELVRLPGEPAALALEGGAAILVGATSDPAFPVVGAAPAPISDSALFVRSGLAGEISVRNTGLTGPVIDVAAVGDKLFALANDVFVSSDGGASWTASGHEATVGRLVLESGPRRIAAAPDDPQTVYASAQGKLLRTRDGGASWTDVTPALADGSAFAPGSIATGPGGRVYAAAYLGRMVRSDDFGETWTEIEAASYVIRILVDPADADRVYAQSAEPHRFGSRLRFSSDGGATWQERTFPTFFDGRQIGAAALLLNPADSSHLLGLFVDAVYESLDGGATWSELGGLWPGARTIEWSPSMPGVLYGLNRNGVARSTDGGRTWAPVEGFVPQDYTDVAVDPGDPETLYVSARGSRLDGFLMGLTPDLRSIAFSTKLGGFGADRPQSVIVEPSGDLLVGGVTDSVDFPSAAPFAGGETDFFVARFARTDRARTAATLLGGSGEEDGLRLALDEDGTVYFAGGSSSRDFPALLAAGGSPEDRLGSIAGALDEELAQLGFSRYLHADRGGCATGLRVDSAGSLLVALNTGSPCPGEGFSSSGSSFVATLGRGDELAAIEPLPLESVTGAPLPAGAGMIVAGNRRLGPSTMLAQPAGVPPSAIGAMVMGFADRAAGETGPRVAAVVDAAAYTGGPLAPGLVGSAFGSGLGPAEGATFELIDNKLPTELASTRVLINGLPASMLFAQDGQINFVASFGLQPRTMAKLEVESATGRSAPWFLPVSVSHVGLFSTEGLGNGFLIALNQDGSLNSEDNPAPIGSVVSVFGVGAGGMSPAFEDGAVAPLSLPLPTPDLTIALTVGERPAEILYAGAAPGLAAGVLQINFRVPDGIGPHGALPVDLQAGEKRFGRRFGLFLHVSRDTP